MFPGSLTLKERQTTRMVTLLGEGGGARLCPVQSPGRSPLSTAHHCHDQRQTEDVKEPCSLGSPHPSVVCVCVDGGQQMTWMKPPRCSRWIRWGASTPLLTCFMRQTRADLGVRCVHLSLWYGSGAVQPQPGCLLHISILPPHYIMSNTT